jgi:hypothetical protein
MGSKAFYRWIAGGKLCLVLCDMSFNSAKAQKHPYHL